MKYKTNPWLIVFTIIITAAVAGGGVYLWQNQNLPENTDYKETAEHIEEDLEEDAITVVPMPINEFEPIAEETEIAEETVPDAATPVPPQISVSATNKFVLKGVINYRVDGSAWLQTEDGSEYDLQIQETTILKGIPDDLLDERISSILKETGKDYPWFGLISDISEYIKEGTPIEVLGGTNIVITDEISL
ncbi:hypothetical protein JW911_04215 [Candidatus Peregrinibacteria bacterium]|nr:hypothetical protein [Candidatus Peregrinibacteria bacterium]